MVKTRDGWETFKAPIIFIGDGRLLTDEELGESVEALISQYRSGVPDEEITTEDLDRSVREHGFRSWRNFFRDCLQMSVELSENYEIVPYERVNQRGTEGAVPMGVALSSARVSYDVGRAVRECIPYCR